MVAVRQTGVSKALEGKAAEEGRLILAAAAIQQTIPVLEGGYPRGGGEEEHHFFLGAVGLGWGLPRLRAAVEAVLQGLY